MDEMGCGVNVIDIAIRLIYLTSIDSNLFSTECFFYLLKSITFASLYRRNKGFTP